MAKSNGKTRRAARQRGPVARLLRRLAEILGLLLAIAVAWVGLYRLMNPPATYLMIEERLRLGKIEAAPVDFAALPPLVRLAFPAAEDARFCLHAGFDLEAIEAALQANSSGGRLRGGSTLTQQVAKNAFLWPGRNWLRKGLEAGFAGLIEAIWPKRRILDVYLQIAEMGEGVFGLQSAAQHYFGVDAPQLSARQAALIAASLPDPKGRDPAHPSAWLSRRANAIVEGARTLQANGAGACMLG